MANRPVEDESYWPSNFVDHKHRLSPNSVGTLLDDEIANNCLKILHVNMRSLLNKLPAFELFLSQLDIEFSCIIVSETWFSEHEYFPKFFLNGYTLSCSSRPNGGGGGVCVYVSEKLEASVTDIPLTGAEAMMVRISRSGMLVSTVLAVYRTPSVGPPEFLADLGALLPTLPSNSAVVGDLNFDLNPENELDSFSLDYLRIMSSNGFYNIINSPTRFGNTKFSLLDHIFINNTGRCKISSCTVLTDILADHLPIIGYIQLPHLHAIKSKTVQVTKIDQGLLRSKINESENWDQIFEHDHPEDAFICFENKMHELIAKSSYTKKINWNKKHTFRKPWMTQELHNLILKKEKLFQKIHDQPYNQILNQKYLNLKNLTANSIKIAKQRFFQDKFETAKSDPNKKWEFVNTVLNRNSSKEDAPSYLSLDGEKITSHQEMTEKFNQFFTTVGTNLAAALPPSDIDPLSYLEKSTRHEIFKFWEISEDVTSKLLQNFVGLKGRWL